MTTFSEESKLLLGNWDAYQDVLKADGRLKAEFQKALNSLQARLRKEGFWNKGWHFQPQGSDQVYIWHDSWCANNESLVWIGVERAAPVNVFGDASPPSVYVWVSKSDAAALIETLRTVITEKSVGYGEIASGKNGYVVQQLLPKCLQEDAERFEIAFLGPVAALIIHYAQWEPDITSAVQWYLKKGK